MTKIKRENADDVLQRVALLSFLYYPEVHVDEPDYSLNDEIDFCLKPFGGLDADEHEELRQLFGRAIIDPSEYREEVFAAITALAAPPPAEQ